MGQSMYFNCDVCQPQSFHSDRFLLSSHVALIDCGDVGGSRVAAEQSYGTHGFLYLRTRGVGTLLSLRLVPPHSRPGHQTTGGLTLLYFLFRLVYSSCHPVLPLSLAYFYSHLSHNHFFPKD